MLDSLLTKKNTPHPTHFLAMSDINFLLSIAEKKIAKTYGRL